MKVVLLLVTFAALVWAVHVPSEFLLPDGHFTTKYDNVDVDEIFRSNRLLKVYVDCLKGLKCNTKMGQFVKVAISDVLENDCARCSQKQRNLLDKFITKIVNEKPKMWAELEPIYDKDGKYRKKYSKQYQDYQQKGEEFRKEHKQQT